MSNGYELRRSQRYSCSALPTLNSSNGRNGTDQTDNRLRGRRTTSLSKLSQFFQNNNILGGSCTVQSALLDLATTGKLMAKIAETQRRGVESMAVWAHNAGNAAIDDVMQQTRQLYQMFTEQELQFSRQYSHYIQQLQKIADAERAVKDAERDVTDLEEKERKLKREIRKGVSFFRQRRGGDVYLLKQRLEEIVASKERAERFLSDIRAEMEVVKMFRFRNGMQGIADAYQNLAQSCQAIFNCHREIIELVPAVSNQDVRHMIYHGTALTRDRVEDLRRSLQNGVTISENHSFSSNNGTVARRRSEPLHQSSHNSPPPPYTPSAPPRQAIPSEYQVGNVGFYVTNDSLHACCQCGQSVQQSSNYHPKHTIAVEESV